MYTNIYNNFIPSKYIDLYFKIINNPNKLSESYTEKHHILPKAIFPEYKNFTKHPWNCAKLSAKEHYEVHELLYLHYKSINDKVNAKSCLYGIWCMATAKGPGQERIKISSGEYSKLKKAMSIELRLNNPACRPEVKVKMKAGWKRLIDSGWVSPKKDNKRSDELCNKISITTKAAMDNFSPAKKRQMMIKQKATNAAKTQEQRQKEHDSRGAGVKLYHKNNPDASKKLSKKMSGEGNPMFGVPPKVKGGKWMNKSNVVKLVQKHLINEFLEDSWTFGRK